MTSQLEKQYNDMMKKIKGKKSVDELDDKQLIEIHIDMIKMCITGLTDTETRIVDIVDKRDFLQSMVDLLIGSELNLFERGIKLSKVATFSTKITELK